MGRPLDALAACERAAALDPSNRAALKFLAKLQPAAAAGRATAAAQAAACGATPAGSAASSAAVVRSGGGEGACGSTALQGAGGSAALQDRLGSVDLPKKMDGGLRRSSNGMGCARLVSWSQSREAVEVVVAVKATSVRAEHHVGLALCSRHHHAPQPQQAPTQQHTTAGAEASGVHQKGALVDGGSSSRPRSAVSAGAVSASASSLQVAIAVVDGATAASSQAQPRESVLLFELAGHVDPALCFCRRTEVQSTHATHAATGASPHIAAASKASGSGGGGAECFVGGHVSGRGRDLCTQRERTCRAVQRFVVTTFTLSLGKVPLPYDAQGDDDATAAAAVSHRKQVPRRWPHWPDLQRSRHPAAEAAAAMLLRGVPLRDAGLSSARERMVCGLMARRGLTYGEALLPVLLRSCRKIFERCVSSKRATCCAPGEQRQRGSALRHSR